MSSSSDDCSAKFEHSSLDGSPGAIRLLTVLPGSDVGEVKCKLWEANLHETEYTAISYQWSDPTRLFRISVNSQHFHVRKNLFDFLRMAHTSGLTGPFWIDAICIIQHDIRERNSQVRIMGQIYSAAVEVWVWLGTCLTTLCASVADVFRKLHLSKPDEIHELEMDWCMRTGDPRQQILNEVIYNEYWTRLWVVQEFLKAKSVLL